MNRQQVLLYALCKTIYRPCSKKIVLMIQFLLAKVIGLLIRIPHLMCVNY